MSEGNIKEFLREIGRKGGHAGKGSPRRIEANRRTTFHREWRKHPAPKRIEEISEKSLAMIEHSG